VTLTIAMRNRWGVTSAGMTATVPAGFSPGPGGLPTGARFDPISGSLSWEGQLEDSVSLPFVFRGKAQAAASGNRQAIAVFRELDTGITYDQPIEISVSDVDLSHSELRVSSAQSGALSTVSMILRNSGRETASMAHAVGLAPFGTGIVTSSLAINGPGAAHVAAGRVEWDGALSARQAVTVSYQVSMPVVSQAQALPLELLIWDGLGSSWETQQPLWIAPYVYYLPVFPR
jgi:hypothetical protein